MALYNRSSGGRAELVATLVNALAHHGLAVDPSVAVEHIENLAHGGEHERWLKSQIDRITAELGSLGGESRPVTARLLVTTPQGGVVHRSAFNVSRWQPALKAAGIPAGRENGQHALRHYYASALLAPGGWTSGR